jgi:hypothetical protein
MPFHTSLRIRELRREITKSAAHSCKSDGKLYPLRVFAVKSQQTSAGWVIVTNEELLLKGVVAVELTLQALPLW